MIRRRGLTLLEVLASTVLLTMLASACLPLLRQAMSDLRQTDEPFALVELTQLAELFLADPSAFGVESLPLESDELHLPWPERPGRSPVTVRRWRADTPPPPPHDHAWVSFSCEGQRIFRWLAVETERESEP
ncbi:MAG: type II secretion system protein [Planctomycetes bacterium]|nr:type II secretion system protein [Planctomycetota bacterium]